MHAAKKMIRWVGTGAVLASAGLCGSPVLAAEGAPNPLTDSFQFSLGTYIVNSDTNLRLDGDLSEGTPINWEDEFGGGDANRFRVDGQWRFADRHKVRFMWFDNSNSASQTLDRDITWGDVTYPVNGKVKGEFSFDIYELAYEYAFMKHETFELDGTIGVHWTTLSAAISGNASSTGEGGVSGSVKSEGSVDAPLPVIGLRGLWVLPHNFFIDAQAQFFAISMDGIDGNIQDYRASVTWQPHKWVGLGVGYDIFRVDVDADTNDFAGTLDWQYDGPMIFYSISF